MLPDEKGFEHFYPGGLIEKPGVICSLEGEKKSDWRKDHDREPHARHGCGSKAPCHLFTGDRKEMEQDIKQYGDHHGQTESAFAHNCTEGRTDKKHHDAG